MSDRTEYGMICAVFLALIALAAVCVYHIRNAPVCDRVVEEGR